MNNCKLSTGDSTVYKIQIGMLEDLGIKRKPYCGINTNKEVNGYAVCSKCDNPIQICCLYHRKPETPRPYGKHLTHDLPFAKYRNQAYEDCPYAFPEKYKDGYSKICKAELDDMAKAIYNYVRNKYDRILYIISKETGIYFSPKLAREMLEDYVRNQGWLYSAATIENIPWSFAYATQGKKLTGSLISVNSPLYEKLKRTNGVAFGVAKMNNYVFVNSKNGTNPLSFTFLQLFPKINSEQDLEEYIYFCVDNALIPPVKPENEIFKTKIKVDFDEISRILRTDNWKSNDKILSISHEIMPEL